ncbi:MAG: hypothetical protein MUC97_17065 [Bernardetiaceae bacterium]|nr:hypothetical protein [Bernardetiaceae bacterium]
MLNFAPHFDTPNGRVKINDFYRWGDPRGLSQQYVNAIKEISGGFIEFKIVEFRDLDVFPVKRDGFAYNQQTYQACWSNRGTCHRPDEVDYPKIIQDQGVVPLINNKTVDEVWMWGAPYFGYWESAMAGPKAFFINGGPFPQVGSNRAFAIMGFNYERGLGEMLHSNCHRAESTMAKVYGGWRADQLTTTWARFAANAKQSNGEAAVGTCHYPPNGQSDYDYTNPVSVMSSADDWYNYPNLTGAKKAVDRSTWGGPDYQLNYLRWWFNHLPRKVGRDSEGKLLNWWKYIYQFNENIID